MFSAYVFEKNKDYPYEKKTNRYKINYYVGKDFEEKYKDYTEIPDFKEAMDKIVAKYDDELAQLRQWENELMNQITTDSTELEETRAFMQSIKDMLSSNIQEDFKYGFN